ncbi:MAG: carboxymuconolactone decarboxylase family protein [Candidatus Limnocylindria bacterium]
MDALARKDIEHAPLDGKDRAMLRYVKKLTLRPGEVEREDVEALRTAGFSDAAIGDVAINAALFAFMNRVVDGLGGQLEGDMLEQARAYGLPLHPGTYEHLDEREAGGDAIGPE